LALNQVLTTSITLYRVGDKETVEGHFWREKEHQ